MRSSDITKYDHGWIRPDGKFFGCNEAEHLWLLEKLETHWTEADEGNWVKIQLSQNRVMYPHFAFLGNYERGITQSQLNALDKFCESHRLDLPWWARVKK